MKKVAMDADTHSRPIRYSTPVTALGIPPAEWQATADAAKEAADKT